MKIGELAKQTQTPSSTLRYYEQIGLLPQAERQHGQRVYDPDVVERVKFINHAKNTGFRLDEIQHFLDDADNSEVWHANVTQKLAELDATIERYQTMRKVLQNALEEKCLERFAGMLS
ncbi:MAG: MerR family transcriptional regulator [Deinococcota bacterium]